MGESDAMIQQHPPQELESASAHQVEMSQEIELSSAESPETAQPPESTLELESELTLEQAPEPEIVSAVLPQAPAQAQAQMNLPCQDLLSDEKRRDFINICIPLYEASIKGDWKTANKILQNKEYELVRYSITEHCDTPLHIAASAQSNTESIKFVKNLVQMMKKEDLKLQNKSGNTALSFAAASGNVDIAKIMVDMDPELLEIPNNKKLSPLYTAVLFRNHAMVNYLYHKSPQMKVHGWTSKQKGWVYTKCVEVDLFDMALKIFKDHDDIPKRENALGLLAKKPCAFNEIKPHIVWRIVNSITFNKVGPAAKESKAMELLRAIWTSIEEKPKSEIDTILKGPLVKDGKGTYHSRVLFEAAKFGNTEFVVELIRKYPDLIWKTNDNGQSIFHIAVYHRHESIYNLLYEIGSNNALITCLRDQKRNNMLHLVGKKLDKNQPPNVSGVAFQLQRELLWYKEVESMIPPHYKDEKNKDDQTPHELFTETHKDLVSEAEKWMRGTASKCMVVAALIATIVFGVAYTIPGGYDEKSGFPLFLHEGPFIVFVVFDAISLILSATSILMFLSILTSRYAQKDFIEALPKKLMVGLATLFLSIVTMMIAFSVSFFVLYRHRFIPIAIIISVLSLIPIIAYGKLQYPLLEDVFRSTFGSRYLFKPKKRILYYQNPSV